MESMRPSSPDGGIFCPVAISMRPPRNCIPELSTSLRFSRENSTVSVVPSKTPPKGRIGFLQHEGPVTIDPLASLKNNIAIGDVSTDKITGQPHDR